MIATARASREDIMAKVQSNAPFLADLSEEQYVKMTFDMVDALRSVDKDSFAWLQNASTGVSEVKLRVHQSRCFSQGMPKCGRGRDWASWI